MLAGAKIKDAIFLWASCGGASLDWRATVFPPSLGDSSAAVADQIPARQSEEHNH